MHNTEVNYANFRMGRLSLVVMLPWKHCIKNTVSVGYFPVTVIISYDKSMPTVLCMLLLINQSIIGCISFGDLRDHGPPLTMILCLSSSCSLVDFHMTKPGVVLSLLRSIVPSTVPSSNNRLFVSLSPKNVAKIFAFSFLYPL